MGHRADGLRVGGVEGQAMQGNERPPGADLRSLAEGGAHWSAGRPSSSEPSMPPPSWPLALTLRALLRLGTGSRAGSEAAADTQWKMWSRRHG